MGADHATLVESSSLIDYYLSNTTILTTQYFLFFNAFRYICFHLRSFHIPILRMVRLTYEVQKYVIKEYTYATFILGDTPCNSDPTYRIISHCGIAMKYIL